MIDVFHNIKESKNKLQEGTDTSDVQRKATTTDLRPKKDVGSRTSQKKEPENKEQKNKESENKESESKKENKSSTDLLEEFPEMDETYPNSIEQDIKKLELNDSLPSRGSRSSSISSQSSNNSTNKFSTNPTKRRLSQNNRNSMLPLPMSKASNPLNQRPSSMLFMNSNSSLSSFPSTTRNEINAATTTTPSGRRRSTSLPISPKVTVLQDNTYKATSGAAAALARSTNLKSPNSPLRSPSGSISSPSNGRSPSGSIKRLGSQTRQGN